MHLTLDFETRSRADLKKAGAWAYAAHASTDVICLAWEEENRFSVWKPGENREALCSAVERADSLHAHNAEFERVIWYYVMHKKYGFAPVPFDKWKCTAALAAYNGLPRSLDEAAKAAHIHESKDSEGHSKMLRYSKPTKDGSFLSDLEGIDRVVQYCIQDVRTEAALNEALIPLPQREALLWQLDQRINVRGIPMDIDSIKRMVEYLRWWSERCTFEIQRVTNGRIQTSGQRDKFLAWAAERGEVLDNLQKDTVESYLKRPKIEPKVREALELRQETARSSTKKYEKILASQIGGRVRGTHLYYGAHTGRWSGKGVQPQNLPRESLENPEMALESLRSDDFSELRAKYGSPSDFGAQLIRSCILAPPGQKFIAADFSAIEARGVFWLAGQQDGIDILNSGQDIYKEMASDIFKVLVSEVVAEQRQTGKNAVLGCGFQIGPERFLQQFCEQGQDLEFAAMCVDAYRERFPKVPDLWSEIGGAAKETVRDGKTRRVRQVLFRKKDDILGIRLPSGRWLFYPRPYLRTKTRVIRFRNKETKEWMEKEMQVTELRYQGHDPQTGKVKDTYTYGGKLTENIVQAIARDLLVDAMFRVEENGYSIVMHTHDEITSLNSEDFGSLQEFEELMAITPEWAEGFPISVEGWEGKRYRK